MRRIIAVIILTVTVFGIIFPGAFGNTRINYTPAATNDKTTVLNHALQYLMHNQSSDGSYGAYYDHHTAAAAYALWLNNSQSSQAKLAYTWLAKTIDDSTSWYWGGYGEADVPGMVLYSLGASNNVGLIHHLNNVTSNLLQFRQQNGGFAGYYSTSLSSSVTSSVDTALALRGLLSIRAVNSTVEQSAVNYLFTLQNSDGSFNLTRTLAYDHLYFQGPGPVSITALVLLALKDASVSNTDQHVGKALDYITRASSQNFPASIDNATVLSASYSLIAFNAYGRTNDAANASSLLISHQNGSTGGYGRDSNGKSNTYDTAWAAIALEQPEVQPTSFVPSPGLSTVDIVASVLGILVVAGGLVFLLRRRGISTKAPANTVSP